MYYQAKLVTNLMLILAASTPCPLVINKKEAQQKDKEVEIQREVLETIGKFKMAVLVIDVQNDFVTGSLKVPGAVGIIPVINDLVEQKGLQMVAYTYILYPRHCVQATQGAKLHADLRKPRNNRAFQFAKGIQRYVESYSIFADQNGNRL
ncbi:unnamed protein product [Strongylus vulgaris]|uniref:Uncharacterized protein n=1 Tax=Strongylus vulgaris TaxID=40348 RepID=A0A3P7JIN6_STRVU|nr:unnamed protein product [Strongylus vulgaris]